MWVLDDDIDTDIIPTEYLTETIDDINSTDSVLCVGTGRTIQKATLLLQKELWMWFFQNRHRKYQALGIQCVIANLLREFSSEILLIMVCY